MLFTKLACVLAASMVTMVVAVPRAQPVAEVARDAELEGRTPEDPPAYEDCKKYLVKL
ncbi:hypothetical protein Hte_010443 [Hypoxylon texense]